MSNIRANRVAEQMKKEMGEILTQKVKDPRIGFVTVTDVEISPDLQESKVFISIFGDEEEKEQTLVGLAKSKGFIRSEIGKRIRLRKVPEINFEIDETIEYGNKIERIIRDLNRDE